MKECYISDAYNRNDFPLVSCWDECVKFYEQEYEICNLGHVHLGKKAEIDTPSYYKEGKKMYDEWVKRINRTLKCLRKAHKRKPKEKKRKRRI